MRIWSKGIATVTVQRGIDVREFSLLSFGGAGGLHAVDLARELEMREAIVPPLAGVFSAIGLLAADVRRDFVTALGGLTSTSADPNELEQRFEAMESVARQSLRAEGFDDFAIELVRSADLKMTGQTYELTVPLRQPAPVSSEGISGLVEAFGQLYRERYAFFFAGEPIELVNLRVAAFGRNASIKLPRSDAQALAPRTSVRPVYFEKLGYVDTSVFQRERLRPGIRLTGPAVIEEATSATLIPAGISADVAPDLGLFMRVAS
jgi:N-methylhydantoinase A